MIAFLLRLFGAKAQPIALDTQLIQRFTELKLMAPAQVDYLVRHESVQQHKVGHIIDLVDAPYRLFLLDGLVKLRSNDGALRFIDAKNPPFPPSLNLGFGDVESAQCMTATAMFRVPLSLLNTPARRAAAAIETVGIRVEEITDTVVEQQQNFDSKLVSEIYNESLNDRLELPSLPDLALSVRKAVNDPKSDAETIARLIQMDVSLTARLIQIANGPFYRGMEQINTCSQAVMRMGLDTTRDIVTSLCLKNVFHSKDPRLSVRLRALWVHSTRVAAISSVLARLIPGVDHERALLAGLLHDIGVLAIIQNVSRFDAGRYSEDELDLAITRLRGEIGSAVLRKWNFDQDLIDVAWSIDDYQRLGQHEADLCDVVQIARIHAWFGTSKASQCPPLLSLPAFQRLPLDAVGPDESIAALQAAKEEISEVLALF